MPSKLDFTVVHVSGCDDGYSPKDLEVSLEDVWLIPWLSGLLPHMEKINKEYLYFLLYFSYILHNDHYIVNASCFLLLSFHIKPSFLSNAITKREE